MNIEAQHKVRICIKWCMTYPKVDENQKVRETELRYSKKFSSAYKKVAKFGVMEKYRRFEKNDMEGVKKLLFSL